MRNWQAQSSADHTSQPQFDGGDVMVHPFDNPLFPVRQRTGELQATNTERSRYPGDWDHWSTSTTASMEIPLDRIFVRKLPRVMPNRSAAFD